jgi:hypothetical protein
MPRVTAIGGGIRTRRSGHADHPATSAPQQVELSKALVTDEAHTRYELACERLELVRAEWDAAGCPFTAPGNRGGTVEHTLHKVLRLQEMLVDRLAQRVRPARLGCPPSAVPGLPPPLERVK